MKVLLLAVTVLCSGCAKQIDLDSDPRGFTVPSSYVGTAAGYRVDKVQDGGVTCYVTEKVGYSGGGISCVGYAPD